MAAPAPPGRLATAGFFVGISAALLSSYSPMKSLLRTVAVLVASASVPAASTFERGHVTPNEEKMDHSEDNFDPDEIFEDIIETKPRDSISDSDLDHLLGPLPRRNNHEHRSALEQECSDDMRERRLYGSRGPGNMIVVCPQCSHRGFGIMGPHCYAAFIFRSTASFHS